MSRQAATSQETTTGRVLDGFFGTMVLAIGALNLWLVHPVPGVIGLLLSLVYVPAVRVALARWMGLRIPLPLRIALGVAVMWFTLGVSDLGDMID